MRQKGAVTTPDPFPVAEQGACFVRWRYTLFPLSSFFFPSHAERLTICICLLCLISAGICGQQLVHTLADRSGWTLNEANVRFEFQQQGEKLWDQ